MPGRWPRQFVLQVHRLLLDGPLALLQGLDFLLDRVWVSTQVVADQRLDLLGLRHQQLALVGQCLALHLDACGPVVQLLEFLARCLQGLVEDVEGQHGFEQALAGGVVGVAEHRSVRTREDVGAPPRHVVAHNLFKGFLRLRVGAVLWCWCSVHDP